MTQLFNYSPADVDEKRAARAHHGTSFSPEKRGKMYVDNYLAQMESTNEQFLSWRTDDNADQMREDLEGFKAGYLKHMWAYLDAHSRIMSQMITGSGGWTSATVRRNNKRNEVTNKRLTEWVEYTPYKLGKLAAKYNPRAIDNQPIWSDDAEAINKLDAKIQKLQKKQALMKAVNAVFRKAKGAEVEEVIDLLMELGISEGNATELTKPGLSGKPGFESFSLTNNSAEIRRLKGRLVELERRAAALEKREAETGSASKEIEKNGIILREDAALMRVMFFFPGKPDAKTRDLLKSNGFKWAPSNGAWQRLLNNNGIGAANHLFTQLTKD